MAEGELAANGEAELAGYFAKYEPAIVKLGKALRAKLRVRLPGLSELVYMYETQNSLVIAYSPTARGGGSDALCSIAVNPDSVKLYFTQGALLSKSDPSKLLQGRAKTVRFIDMKAASDLDRPDVEALMTAALELAKLRLDPNAKGSLIMKAGEQRERASRAKKAARKTAPRRAKKAGH